MKSSIINHVTFPAHFKLLDYNIGNGEKWVAGITKNQLLSWWKVGMYYIFKFDIFSD